MDAVWDSLSQGGFVMPPLVLTAGLLWYGMGYRFLLLHVDARDGAHDGLIARARAAVRHATSPRARRTAVAPFEDQLGQLRGVVLAAVRIAPLLGLLGTVSGMIETFDSLGEMTLVTQDGGIAGGISEALFSTQMGLVVAVPGLILGRLLDRRETRIRARLAALCQDDFLHTPMGAH